MSHFTVLVIGDNPEEQLAPFQENNMGDCPKQYLEFRDQEPEMREEYETESITRVVMPDGSLLAPWDETFKVHKEGAPSFEFTHVVPENLIQREVPFKELYPTLDAYIMEYHGYKGRDEETGLYGYWENPAAKWDWFQMGGRWTGFYKLKPGVDGIVGNPGIMTPRAEEGHADQTMVGDVDFAAMRDEAGEKARKEYLAIAKVFGGSIPRLEMTWKEVLAMPDMDIDQKREFFQAQKPLRMIAEMKTNKTWPSDRFFFDLEDYACTEEEYVQQHRDSAIVPFAFVRDGKWCERGKMGWWACVSNEKDKTEWNRQFNQMMDELPANTLLTLVDCHI